MRKLRTKPAPTAKEIGAFKCKCKPAKDIMFGIVATIKLLLLHSREGTITYPTWKKRKSSSKVPFKRGICDRSPGGYQRPLELNFSWESSDFSAPTSKTPKPTKRELNDTVF